MNAPRLMPLPPQYPYKIDPDDPIFLSVQLYEQAFKNASAQLQEDLRLATQQIIEELKQQTTQQITQADRRVNAIINQGAEHLVAQLDARNRLLLEELDPYFQHNFQAKHSSGTVPPNKSLTTTATAYASTALISLCLGAFLAKILG